MLGLPKVLEVDGEEYQIRYEYNVALIIFEAFNDIELTDKEKILVMLQCLYVRVPNNIEEAIEKAIWFLDGGKRYEIYNKSKKIIDWEQDEQIIFSALNKVAGFEIREKNCIHWWTFLGYFNELGDGLLSTVINIRSKKNRGKNLDKTEEEFYKNNKEMINIKTKYTAEEQIEIERLNKILQ